MEYELCVTSVAVSPYNLHVNQKRHLSVFSNEFSSTKSHRKFFWKTSGLNVKIKRF